MSSYVINEILKNRKITEYLASKGYHPIGNEVNGKLRYRCPLHEGDNTPSFMVYLNADHENFYCYGCIDENEMIWTPSGLKQISYIQSGDVVIDYHGKKQVVLCVEHKTGDSLGIALKSFREPLILTKDHKCLAIKQKNALKSFRRLFYHSPSKSIIFRPDLKDRPKYEDPKILEINASSLEIGDYFLFPIIKDRYNYSLSGSYNIKKYTKGPRVNRIKKLVVSKESAWFYGLYVAEGSISGNRIINLSLHANEEKIAKKAISIIKKTYNISGKYNITGNSLDAYFCSADLANHLKTVFGDGACNKKIDGKMMYWNQELQRSFISGYQIGDGNKKDGTTGTCSKILAESIFGISIQAGYFPSFYKPVLEKTDKNEVHHNKYYNVGFRCKERSGGFYENINGTKYYLMPIREIVDVGQRNVVDISVSGTETFITKMGATHNCRAKYNIIHLYRDLEKVSMREAIKALSNGLDMDVDSEIEHIIKEIENDASIYSRFSFVDFDFIISRQIYDFLKQNNSEENIQYSEILLSYVDKAITDCNIEGLNTIYENLPDTLRKRAIIFDECRNK